MAPLRNLGVVAVAALFLCVACNRPEAAQRTSVSQSSCGEESPTSRWLRERRAECAKQPETCGSPNTSSPARWLLPAFPPSSYSRDYSSTLLCHAQNGDQVAVFLLADAIEQSPSSAPGPKDYVHEVLLPNMPDARTISADAYRRACADGEIDKFEQCSVLGIPQNWELLFYGVLKEPNPTPADLELARAAGKLVMLTGRQIPDPDVIVDKRLTEIVR